MGGRAVLLSHIQQLLGQIYDLDAAHDVYDFLVTDRALARALEADPEARDVREKLLVKPAEDGVDVSLYLDPELLEHLTRDDPLALLHDGNLAEFCTVLEGVSHFVYLAFNATYDKSVTLLEMELQAEVDKFVSSSFLLGQQQAGPVTDDLHDWLFAEPCFDTALDEDGLERYRDANHYASRYCLQLAAQLDDARSRSRVMSELRRFYRLPQQGKIRRATADSA